MASLRSTKINDLFQRVVYNPLFFMYGVHQWCLTPRFCLALLRRGGVCCQAEGHDQGTAKLRNLLCHRLLLPGTFCAPPHGQWHFSFCQICHLFYFFSGHSGQPCFSTIIVIQSCTVLDNWFCICILTFCKFILTRLTGSFFFLTSGNFSTDHSILGMNLVWRPNRK